MKKNTLDNYVIKSEEQTVSFLDILIIIIKNIKTFILIPIITTFFTTVYLIFFAEPVFTSYTKITSSGGSHGTQFQGLASEFGINIPGSSSEKSWVYSDIIKSKTISKKLLDKRFDTQKYGKNKTLLQILTYGNEEPKLEIETLKIIAANKLSNKLISVSEDRKTKIFTISVNTFEAELSKNILTSLTNELDNHQSIYNKNITSKTKNFIIGRIIETKKELDQAEEGLKNFRERNRRIENSFLLQMEEQRLSREVSVLTSVFTTLKQQLETSKIEEVRDSDYIVVIDSPETPLEPSSPQKLKILLGAIIVGFLISGVLIIIIFYLDQITDNDKKRIKSLDIFKDLL